LNWIKIVLSEENLGIHKGLDILKILNNNWIIIE